MESIVKAIENYLPYILGGMTVVILLLFIIIIILFKSINNLEAKYRRMMRGASGKNIEELVTKRLDEIDAANSNCEKALEQNKVLEEKIRDCVQKVAIMRYKAFENVGSDLSFSIAILDGNDDGVLLTGIYGREESTTYAKPVDKGISRYDLSEEEITVLNEAIKKEI